MKTQKRLEIRLNESVSVNEYIRGYDINSKS